MEETTKRLEIISHLVELFKETPADVVQRVTYLMQGKVRPDFEGIEPGVAEKTLMRAISKSSGIPLRKVAEEYQRSGDMGLAASRILEGKTQTTFLTEDVTVERVYDTIYRIAQLEGARSQDMKMKYVSSLLNDASPLEARFILKMLLGTMRLGVAENTIMDALAEAYIGHRANRPTLERAYNVSSDLGRVAETAARHGIAGMEVFEVRLFSPIRPMLAERIRSEQEAITKMCGGFAEYKLDGERVQIHIDRDRVEIFSRRLECITPHYPDIVQEVPTLIKANQAILEAEAVAVSEVTGSFLPFQELMHRRRKHGIKQAVSKYPISVNFFDILYVNGRSCMDMPYIDRRRLMLENVHEQDMARLVPAEAITDEVALAEFMESSINAGGEGLMLKSGDSNYRAGSRGSQWLKLKQEYKEGVGDSLDLAVIGAFHGRGRRTGMYGTLLLAVYDEEGDMFRSICKVGTGFKDEDLDTVYQLLNNKIVVRKDSRVESNMEADVWFVPELVIEVECSEITLSPIHTAGRNAIRKDAGLALRFPKFTGRVRQDKLPEDVSTVQEVVALYKGQKKSVYPSDYSV